MLQFLPYKVVFLCFNKRKIIPTHNKINVLTDDMYRMGIRPSPINDNLSGLSQAHLLFPEWMA